MLNFTKNIELYYKDYIKNILYKIVEDENIKRQNYVEVDEENKRYLLVTNGEKYYIWISKFSESKFLKDENKELDNKAIIFIFNRNLDKEQWVIIPDNVIKWENSDEYLFEGYLFDNEMYFSDTIYPNFNRGYIYRRTIMKEIFTEKTEKMVYIREYRGEKDIILGKIINMIEIKEDGKDETMKRLILKNFKHNIKNTTEEIVNGKDIIKSESKQDIKVDTIEDKIIERGNKIEIYNVYNVESHNKEGLLWVKTLKQSIFLREEFKEDVTRIKIKCRYDTNKQKWTKYEK
jgi:hypothetical protein